MSSPPYTTGVTGSAAAAAARAKLVATAKARFTRFRTRLATACGEQHCPECVDELILHKGPEGIEAALLESDNASAADEVARLARAVHDSIDPGTFENQMAHTCLQNGHFNAFETVSTEWSNLADRVQIQPTVRKLGNKYVVDCCDETTRVFTADDLLGGCGSPRKRTRMATTIASAEEVFEVDGIVAQEPYTTPGGQTVPGYRVKWSNTAETTVEPADMFAVQCPAAVAAFDALRGVACR